MIRGAWDVCGYQMPGNENTERFEGANDLLIKLDKQLSKANENQSQLQDITNSTIIQNNQNSTISQNNQNSAIIP